MANRRLISRLVIDTDRFAMMSLSARYLYFELAVRADDDGFLGAPMRVVRMVGCEESDLEELERNEYVIKFKTGVIVIRDWNVHNTIRKDMYKETIYQKERDMLCVINGRYYLKSESMDNVTDNVTCDVTDNVTCDVTLNKDKKSKGKRSKDNLFTSLTLKEGETLPPSADAGGASPFTLTDCQECAKKGKVNLSDDGIKAFYDRMEKDDWKIKGSPVTNLLLAMRGFAKNHKRYQKQNKKEVQQEKKETKPDREKTAEDYMRELGMLDDDEGEEEY